MTPEQLLNADLALIKDNPNLPQNLYAMKVLDLDRNEEFIVSIIHDGYCPSLCTDHEQSYFMEYLSNLSNSLITAYFKSNNYRRSKKYYSLCEIMTDKNGKLYSYSRAL